MTTLNEREVAKLIGVNLRALRVARRISAKVAAINADMNPSQYRCLERGTHGSGSVPSLRTIIRACNAIDVPITAVLRDLDNVKMVGV